MILRIGLLLAMMMTWSCSGDDDQQPKEPVAAEDTNKVPNTPGETGEAAMKPAGEGMADAAKAAEPAPAAAAAPEKSEPAAAPAAAAGDMVVKAGALNVRKGPGTKHGVVRTLKKGEHVAPMSCTGSWCKLAENEYVSKKYLGKAK